MKNTLKNIVYISALCCNTLPLNAEYLQKARDAVTTVWNVVASPEALVGASIALAASADMMTPERSLMGLTGATAGSAYIATSNRAHWEKTIAALIAIGAGSRLVTRGPELVQLLLFNALVKEIAKANVHKD